MKRLLTAGLLAILTTTLCMARINEREVLSDELCDKLCAAAHEKSRELGVDISFAIADRHGLPRVYRRYGDALVLSITLVPGKAYTAAVTRCRTKDVAAAAAEGAPLMGIQTNDPHITLVAGGYPLFADGRIVGAVGVGGGTEAQDCEIAEYVVKVFEESVKTADGR